MLTQKELKRKIEYNPETGEFFRKLKSGKKLINNRPNKDGYILLGVAGGWSATTTSPSISFPLHDWKNTKNR